MKNLFLFFGILLFPLVLNAQSWQYTGNLNTDRWLSEMVTLDNGTVLIAGGFQREGGPLASCEIYDPSTASWAYTGNLNVARAFPTLVKLTNGHILSLCGATTFGGAESTGDVEDYDPSTGNWTIVGHLQLPRMVPTATTMNDGKILISGGLSSGSGTTSNCEIYDPATNTSTTTGSMLVNRYCAQAVLMGDGSVMVAGGRDGGSSSNYFSECEIFDPASATWTVAEPMHQARIVGILTRFSDNTILAAAGRNTDESSATGSEIFTTSSMTWQSTDAIKQPVCWAGNIPFPDNRFMTTGGIVNGGNWANSDGLEDVSTATCEWYDRTLQEWYYAPTLNLTRCKHNAVYLHQTANPDLPTDLVLVAGGKPGTIDSSMATVSYSFTNTAEILDVTQPALLSYMKMQINASVPNVPVASDAFKAYYENDGSIKIVYTCNGDQSVSLDIMSVDGRLAKQLGSIDGSNGSHSYAIATNNLASGAYFIRYVSSSANYIFKFIVNH